MLNTGDLVARLALGLDVPPGILTIGGESDLVTPFRDGDGMTNTPGCMPVPKGKRSPQAQAFMDTQWRNEERVAMREPVDADYSFEGE